MSCSWKQSRTGKRMHIVRDGDRVPLSATWSDCRVEPSMSEYADHSDAGSQAWISHSVISFDYRVVEVPREGCSIPLRCFDLWPYAPPKVGRWQLQSRRIGAGRSSVNAVLAGCFGGSTAVLVDVERIPPFGRVPICLEKQVVYTLGASFKNIIEKLMGGGDAPPSYPHDEDGSSPLSLAVASSRQSLFRCRDLDAVLSGYDLPHATDSDVESMVVGAPAAVSPNDV
jgi:hypothetical protein